MTSNILIDIDHLTAAYRIDPVLKDIQWQWQAGQHWAIVGGNGAGKSALANVICDQLRPFKGQIQWRGDIDPNHDIAHLSFALQKQMMLHDNRFDDSEVRDDAFDRGTTVAAAILQGKPRDARFDQLAQQCGVAHILDRGIRFISTGESRKTLLARALYANPKILILDNPYEGLDRHSQADMAVLIGQLLQSELPTLLLLQQAEDIPPQVDHVLLLDNGAVIGSGPRQHVAGLLGANHLRPVTQLPPARARDYAVDKERPLIELRNVSVSYQERPILNAINWRFDWGQHCCISGPNGAGKSTLLSLVSGENHKAYGQAVELFGRRRGTGESVWEIKQKFGVVSTAMQLNHVDRLRVAEVVASGLYDTVGLYQNCSGQDRDLALQWLNVMDLEAIAEKPYNQLSFGQQRLALLARAMVKSPLILILDEPCIGLDHAHREQILSLIDQIASQSDTHILYVSHSANEMPRCINQQLQLIPHQEGGYTAKVSTN